MIEVIYNKIKDENDKEIIKSYFSIYRELINML
jgi:hypothetical protein